MWGHEIEVPPAVTELWRFFMVKTSEQIFEYRESEKKKNMLGVHPWKLTCPLKSDHFSREYIFQPSIFWGHVSFQGSNVYWCHWHSIMTSSFRLHYESWLWLSHETHQFKIQHHDSSKYVLQFQPGSIIQVRELFIYMSTMSCMMIYVIVRSCANPMSDPNTMYQCFKWTCSMKRNTKNLPCSCYLPWVYMIFQ